MKLVIIAAILVVLFGWALISTTKTPDIKPANTTQVMELWDACGGERVITMMVSESGGLTTTVNCFTNGGE